ncbi:MAG: glycosyltransferase [Candidatus Woesearchaeota archaeon]
MVNSTKVGGGVAVLLQSIVPYLNQLGVRTEWLVLEGDTDFFSVTKSFHNALQGEVMADILEQIKGYDVFYNERFDSLNVHLNDHFSNLSGSDIVVIHDPQPLKLIAKRKDDGSKWIWRTHIDTSNPDDELWDFVFKYAMKFDAAIASKRDFTRGRGLNWVTIPPSIDPLASKNRLMEKEEVKKILSEFNIPLDKPLITQVSRLDKWKDPLGVIQAFDLLRDKYNIDCSLALVYNGATDDPEGGMMLQLVQEQKENSSYKNDIHLIWGDNQDVVNAFQTGSDLVMQKSLREGFALTVSEALWKATPVIGTKVGGIPLQIKHGHNGFLVDACALDETDQTKKRHHLEQVAYYMYEIISDPARAKEMGKNAHEFVRENFLVSRHIKDYLILFNNLAGSDEHQAMLSDKY